MEHVPWLLRIQFTTLFFQSQLASTFTPFNRATAHREMKTGCIQLFHGATVQAGRRGQPAKILTFQGILIEPQLTDDIPGNVSLDTLSFFRMAFCCFQQIVKFFGIKFLAEDKHRWTLLEPNDLLLYYINLIHNEIAGCTQLWVIYEERRQIAFLERTSFSLQIQSIFTVHSNTFMYLVSQK